MQFRQRKIVRIAKFWGYLPHFLVIFFRREIFSSEKCVILPDFFEIWSEILELWPEENSGDLSFSSFFGKGVSGHFSFGTIASSPFQLANNNTNNSFPIFSLHSIYQLAAFKMLEYQNHKFRKFYYLKKRASIFLVEFARKQSKHVFEKRKLNRFFLKKIYCRHSQRWHYELHKH